MRVAIQMDPIADIDIEADTTFALGLEAQTRGHTLYYYEPDQLMLADGTAHADLRPLTLADIADAHYTLGEATRTALTDMDVVLMRQDPPFDMHYIAATHFLETIHPATLVVNDPAAVRNAPEKIFPLRFPDLVPPTLLARDMAALAEFRATHGDIILKPLFGNGGAGIVHVRADDDSFTALAEMFLAGREPVIAQKYLPAIREGDKRVLLVEGEAAGAVNRIPAAGEARANLHVGGRAAAVDLSDRDREIVSRIGAPLRDMGIVLAGIDIIGGQLTEINVTSPTGIREVKRLGGDDVAVAVWDAIEARQART